MGFGGDFGAGNLYAASNLLSWKMVVLRDTGAGSTTITYDTAINAPAITEFRLIVRADGSCVEGSFTGRPASLDVMPRDIITFSSIHDDGAGGTIELELFRGYVTKSGIADQQDLRTYRLVGLQQRFYEQVAGVDVIAGVSTPGVYYEQDVAAMANEIIVDYQGQVLGITGVDIPAPINFTIGDRVPNYQTVGEFLDDLVASVPELLVASGATYVYDGVTYGAGELVPGASWGVRADGTIFFRRAVGTGTVNGSSPNVVVDYQDVDAEEIVTKTVLVLDVSNKEDVSIKDRYYSTDAKLVTVTPGQYPSLPYYKTYPIELYEDDEHSKYTAIKVIPFSVDNSGFVSAVTQPSTQTVLSPITNHTLAVDGDPTTFAFNPAPTITEYGIWNAVVGGPAGFGSGSGPIGVRILHSDESQQHQLSDPLSLFLNVKLSNGLGDKATFHELERELDGESHNTAVTTDFFFTASAQQREVFSAVFDLTLQIPDLSTPADTLRIYEISVLYPNTERLGDVGRYYIRKPATNPADVTIYGTWLEPTPRVTLTKADASTVNVPAATYEYAMDANEGLRTIVKLEQDLDADAAAQRALINRKDQTILKQAVRINRR